MPASLSAPPAPVREGVGIPRRRLFGEEGVAAVELGVGSDALGVLRRLDPDAARTDRDGAFLFADGSATGGLVGRGTLLPTPGGTLTTLRREHDRLRSGGVELGLVVALDAALAAETTGAPATGADSSAVLAVEEAVEVDDDGRARLLLRADLPAPERRRRAALVRHRLAGAAPRSTPPVARPPAIATLRMDGPEYLAAIEACQRRIADGDAYQLCLTTQAAVEVDRDPLEIWRTLAAGNGSARGALLRLGRRWLVSASPEQFLTVTADGVVSTSPMKGTRPRGADEREDRALAGELAASEKERAENVMIVDLMRNDLSRVCRPESVRVSRLLQVERHPQVLQLVSTVEGRLADGRDAVDTIAACFPAGSMTGAPKRRAIELLQGIEAGPRGPYAGAFGVLAADGSADLTMTIRTAVLDGGTATVGSGGGITAMSDPQEELAEMRLKLRGVLAALGARLPDTDPSADR